MNDNASRLRQFGLSPELTQVAGFSSLLIACLGLAALNFSSHYALNAYGISCAIFIVFMLFGMLPDKWRNSIKEQQQQSSLHQQLLQANYTSTLTGSAPKGPQAPTSLVLDLIYCTLLLTFGTLLVFAFIFAHYLRRHEVNELEEEEFERSGAREADGLCNRRNCTCDMRQATVTTSSGLGSLPNLNHQTSEDSLVPRYSSLSHSAIRWAPAAVVRPAWQAQDNQHLRQNLSSRSLVSLTNERPDSMDDELDRHQRQVEARITSSLRHQARRISNAPLPPLVHRGFYHAAGIKEAPSARRADSPVRQQSTGVGVNKTRSFNGQHAPDLPDSARYPQVEDTYRQPVRPQRSINIDDTRCRCGSSVASTLAAKLQQQQPSLTYDYQNACKVPLCNNGFSHAAFKCERYPSSSATGYATNHIIKQRRTKPSGSSVMAMTAAAAAALFGGVVDASPLEGAADQGGADGMIESTLDDCGGPHGDIIEDYVHQYEGLPFSSGTTFGHHQHQQSQFQHESDCNFDDGQHEITGIHHTNQANAGLVYAPPWDYGPIMSEVVKR